MPVDLGEVSITVSSGHIFVEKFKSLFEGGMCAVENNFLHSIFR